MRRSKQIVRIVGGDCARLTWRFVHRVDVCVNVVQGMDELLKVAAGRGGESLCLVCTLTDVLWSALLSLCIVGRKGRLG